MKFTKSFDGIVDLFLKTGIILVTISVIASMTLQVCSRYFIPLPLYGLDEFTGHTAVWFYFLGAAYSSAHNDHIRADMLDLFKVSAKGQHYVSIFTSIISIVISGYMIVWTYNYVKWSIARNELTPSLHIPAVYFQSAILVGAVLMFLFFIKELVRKIMHDKAYDHPHYGLDD